VSKITEGVLRIYATMVHSYAILFAGGGTTMEEFFRKLKKERPTSLGAVAQKMGINRSTLYRELRSDMRLSTLLRLADAMDYEIRFYTKDGKRGFVLRDSDLTE